MKNKKTFWRVSAFVICIFICIIIGILIYNSSKLKLISRLDELINNTYNYTVNCTIDGLDSPFLGEQFKLKIIGHKGTDILYGQIKSDAFNYMELYVNSKGNMIFNVEPFFKSILSIVEEKFGRSLSIFNFMLNDINISLEQLEEIIGKDIITISDAGVTSDVFKDIIQNNTSKITYSLKREKNLDEEYKLLGNDAIYFVIEFDDNDSSVIIGIPDSNMDKEICVEIIYGDLSWKFVGEYMLAADQGIEMPEETLSDTAIDVLKKIYSYWDEVK